MEEELNALALYTRAIRDAERLLQRQTDDFELESGVSVTSEAVYALVARSRSFQRLGAHEEARKDAEHALEIDPNSSLAYWCLGNAFSSLEDSLSALAAYERAIELDPHEPMFFFNRGAVLAEQLDRPEEAVVAYTKVVRLEPENVRAWNNCGVALAEIGDREGAIERFSAALRLRKHFLPALYNRGCVYSQLGKLQHASVDLELAKRLQPENADILNAIGVLRVKQGCGLLRMDSAPLEAFSRAVALSAVGSQSDMLSKTLTNRAVFHVM